jgi:eukaryotic-like serine/threonine-protein kinase
MAETRPDPRSDTRLLMRAIAVLDPRMPVCWRGVAMRPQGAAGLLSAAIGGDTKMMSIIQEIFIHDVIAVWASGRTDDRPFRTKRAARIVAACQRLVTDGVPDALLHSFYAVNPMLPCAVPAKANNWIVDIDGLLRWLDKAAAGAKGMLVDPALIAFIGARASDAAVALLPPLNEATTEEDQRLAELHLLRQLQADHDTGPLQALTAWAAKRLAPAVETWRNRPLRQQIAARLADLAKAGDLTPMLDLLFNKGRRQQDEAGEHAAIEMLASIDAEIRAIGDADDIRTIAARHFGSAIVGGTGLAILIIRLFGIVVP